MEKQPNKNEGFSADNLPEDYNPAPAKLQQELETDKEGDTKTVNRQREPEGQTPKQDSGIRHNQNQKAVENRDRNSDPATNRYDANHPDNHKDRGNPKLDA